MKKGNPAAALAIIASIFGAAGVICLLPDARSDYLAQAPVLPAQHAFVINAFPAASVERPELAERFEFAAEVAPAVEAPITVVHVRVADPVVTSLQFSSDVGAPPALAATHLSLVSASATPVAAEPPTIEERRMGPVPAAFDRTGSALVLAFRKTGAGVKTAFSALTP